MADDTLNTESGTHPPSLTIDWEAYLPLIEDPDVPEDQKRELIQTLWSIVVSFVDMGFGLTPVPQSCGQDDGNLPDAIRDVLSLEDQTNHSDEMPSAQCGAGAGKESHDRK